MRDRPFDTPSPPATQDRLIAELDAEEARLQGEIAAGRQELISAAREVTAPLRRAQEVRERAGHFARTYGLLLLPVVVLVALRPRASMRVASHLWEAWLGWSRHSGPLDARVVGMIGDVLHRRR